ncbi:neurogenic locus notch homolog protein 1-like isoform X2 [Macrosteles quadrilineatus]|uniref:neurogenic locus notch homolog protein 1-like isoform X2 n=1 Tax=Macrosteles quadrilineatus TaxID=74068 RepID=UPI0023E13EB8|nr:neurogenic locus notch homolog protein 1-like isoform X2 [Macrosteles quadrilineatus]
MVQSWVLLPLALAVFISSQIQTASANKTVPCYDVNNCDIGYQVCDTSTGKCVDNPCSVVRCMGKCVVVYKECPDGEFPCPPRAECQPREGEKCGEYTCKSHEVCDRSASECIENPCNYAKCGPGKECRVNYVQCFKAPCPPLAECVPTAGSCDEVRCDEGSHCEDGACVLDDRCALVLCITGSYCYKGSCFKEVECGEGECGPAQKCYTGTEPCNQPHCPSKRICVTDKCAVVRCRSGTHCVDGKCVPRDPCL